MKKCLLSILLAIIYLQSNAQNSSEQISVLANDIIRKEFVNEKIGNLKVDSFSLNTDFLQLYFNTNQLFSKQQLEAAIIEQLPEALHELATKLNKQSVMLYAKDKQTLQWKTIDYFANHPVRVIYEANNNVDVHIQKTTPSTANNQLVQKIFPSSGSPSSTGALAGKTVWLSPGHGWQNTGTGLGFLTQRGTTNEVVEDFTTAESIDYYLMNYLINAGANVWSVRERDYNPLQIIVDNDNPTSGYSETGTWTTGSASGYGGTYKYAISSATENATAVYTPNVTTSGLYWVSVRYVAGANRATNTQYTIIHSGDTSVVLLNQEVHGTTWVYLGQYYFTAGSLNKIILSNQSSQASQAIIADAVRLGGGTGTEADCVNTTEGSSNRPRFEESARQFAQFQSYPSCVEDVTVRPKFSEYELSKGTSTEINNAVYVSWHTNAGGGSGTETYSYNGLGSGRPTITAGSENLRNYIHNQLITDIRAGWNSAWSDRGVKTANFGELRELNTIPGTLIELAFHDLASDATQLRHPEFRRLAARAIYKGILKFFNNRDGIPLVVLPEQPTNVYAKNIANNQIQISWNAPTNGGIYGDAATGYKVYISTNGKSFKDGITVTTTNYTFTGNANTTYFFKIAATNAGGESFTSSVVAARTPVTSSATVPFLIVDGFDRLDANAMIPKTESSALGVVKRMMLDKMNRYDYMIEHAKGLANCSNIAFDGCQNEAVSGGAVLLNNYVAVDWFVGEESTVDVSIDATERSLLKTYLNGGGSLLISGSEIGWDLGRTGSTNLDADFYNNYLRATYVNDDAGTYNFDGTTTFFASQTGTFDNSNAGYYDVDSPDRIAATNGSSIVINYNGGSADGAALGYTGTYKLLYFAFPLETVTNETTRNNLFCNAVAFLTPNLVVPTIGLQFNGYNNKEYNFLSWVTKAEANVAFFTLERSENGILFTEISHKIIAKGNSTSGYSYGYTDNSTKNITYYRLKIVDADGKVTYSPVLKITSKRNNLLFDLQENPAKNNITLNVKTNNPFEIIVTDAQGKMIVKSAYTKHNNQKLTINCSNFVKGLYTITLITSLEKQVAKILVQ